MWGHDAFTNGGEHKAEWQIFNSNWKLLIPAFTGSLSYDRWMGTIFGPTRLEIANIAMRRHLPLIKAQAHATAKFARSIAI